MFKIFYLLRWHTVQCIILKIRERFCFRKGRYLCRGKLLTVSFYLMLQVNLFSFTLKKHSALCIKGCFAATGTQVDRVTTCSLCIFE